MSECERIILLFFEKRLLPLFIISDPVFVADAAERQSSNVTTKKSGDRKGGTVEKKGIEGKDGRKRERRKK